MVRRLFSLKGLTALVFAGFLGGCALSPQNVTIAPEVQLASDPVKLDGPVTVTAFDERVTPWIGTRGGVYKESNRIGIANSLQDAVKLAVEKSLLEQGMQPGSSAEAPQFQVYVDTLEYTVPASNYITKVDLKASIRVTVRAGSKFYQGSYSAADSQRVMKAPSDESNAQMINDILGKAIARAFEDPGLMRFMARL